MLNEAEHNVIAFSPRARRTDKPLPPTDENPLEEVERLRLQVKQHEHALARLAEAMLNLRRGAQALQAENRELRRALDARPTPPS